MSVDGSRLRPKLLLYLAVLAMLLSGVAVIIEVTVSDQSWRESGLPVTVFLMSCLLFIVLRSKASRR